MGDAGVVDRLSQQDVSNLRIETRGLAMHVAGLAILDEAQLFDSEGNLRLEALQAEIEGRSRLAPRLRQVLYRPTLGLGRPLWIDDPRFDIASHVRTRSVPLPGDEQALLEMCMDINQTALDRSRPLWEVWFLTGLSGGNVGMLIRLHHVVADGIASVALLGSLFDFTADTQSPIPPPLIPRPIPSSWALLADNIRRRGAAPVKVFSSIARPSRVLKRLRAIATAMKDFFGEGLAPRSSLNVPAGNRRRLILVRADLERVKAVAHSHGAKVNDVVLAAVAGGARELLRRRRELRPGLELRASVPVSYRGPGDQTSQGNLVSLMIVSLPVGESDLIRRVEKIARATAHLKGRPHLLGALPGSLLVQRLLIGLIKRQRMVNLFTSNVPGPPVPIYFAGAPVLELFQVGVIQGNVTLSVGVLSYRGQLNFDIVADADAIPDLDAFAKGLTDALEELDVGMRVTTLESKARVQPTENG